VTSQGVYASVACIDIDENSQTCLWLTFTPVNLFYMYLHVCMCVHACEHVIMQCCTGRHEYVKM